MLKPLNHPGAATSPAYSEAVEVTAATRTLYISGQVGIGPDGTVPAGVGPQATIAIARVNALLAQAGMSSANIAKYTIYLTDETLLPAFVAAAGGALPQPPPAATLVIVKGLAMPGLLVEIEAIAVA